jgi:hypothetical protein
MTAQYDLDRALGAWFVADAAPAASTEPLVHVLESTRQQRPRPLLVAGIGGAWVGSRSDGPASEAAARARSLVRVALIAALVTALLGAAVLVGSRLLAPRPLPHRYLDQLTSATDLSIPMYGPTLVPLTGGSVLVIDNAGGPGTSHRALVYDPLSGSSTEVGPVAWGDVGPAVRLLDGRVLLLGATVSHVFDPATMQFVPVGQMGIGPRWGAAAALLHDGRVLVTGGAPENGSDVGTTAAEVFDPATSTFSATGSMVVARTGHAMATLPDGHVFVTPGVSRVAELFDPSSGTFSPAGSTTDTAEGKAIALPDGRVVILQVTGLQTGERFWIWDPERQLVQLAGSSGESVMDATLLDDGRIFLVGLCRGRAGGWTGTYVPGGAVAPTPPTRACRPSATRLADGRVLIVGGVEPGLPFVEVFQ